ncbi:MAG: 30S ribosomal protein S20 [Clostridiaceae bacterium]|nr:30S ribosomal protein S20 [Clostridiaceae bacterium]
MPNIKSAIKRVRTSEKKNAENKMLKSELRTVIKKAKASVASSDEKAEVLVKATQKAIDQAAAKNLMHKNAAARKKSRMTKAANAAKKAE